MDDETVPGCARVSLFLKEADPGSEEWVRLLTRTRTAVAANATWAVAVPAWMEETAELLRPERVQVVVVPGCDLITCLTYARPSGAFELTGHLEVELRGPLRRGNDASATGRAVRRLRSRLEWTGAAPDSVRARVRDVYPTPESWARAKETGDLAETDRRLLASLGLVDTLWEERAERSERRALDEHLVTTDSQGRIQRQAPISRGPGGDPVWPGRQHVRRFVRRHRQDLVALGAEFADATT